MKISIAVPSLNQGRFLGDCLASIHGQRHADFEVLIADGGSTDASLNTIAAVCAEDARFSLVSTSDRGQADAVARALDLATGDICTFLNADDVYLNTDVFRKVVQHFTHDAALDVLSGTGMYIDEDGLPIKQVNLRYHPLDGLHLMKRRTAVLQPATFWRRTVMATVKLPTGLDYAFDAWFFYDLWSGNFKWREVADSFAGYRLHGDNKSLRISVQRTLELAALEDHKFGPGSWRGAYLRTVAQLLRRSESTAAATSLKQLIRLANNSVSYLTVYHVPGI